MVDGGFELVRITIDVGEGDNGGAEDGVNERDVEDFDAGDAFDDGVDFFIDGNGFDNAA